MNGDNSDETVIIDGDAFLKELAEIVKEADALRTKCAKEGIDTEKFHKEFELHRKLCFKIAEDFYYEEIKGLLERRSNL